MNETHFIFKIGPIPTSEGEANAYFVMPAKNSSLTYLADDDRSGLEQILKDYDVSTLECEPELAPIASEFGVNPGLLTPDRAHLIGGMAFDLALGDHFRTIEREGIVYAFAVACSAFWQASPWRYRSMRKPLQVVLRGALNDTLTGMVLGGQYKYGFSMYQDIDSIHRSVELAETGRLEEAARLNTLIVTLDDQPAFAVDAMRRAYGLPCLPIPTKMNNGQGTMLRDVDLMALGAAVKAISILTDDISASTGEIEVDDLRVEAIVQVNGVAK